MMGKVEKVVKYGVEVFSNLDADELRKTECLCLNCGNLRLDSREDNCPIANRLYDICVAENVAMQITRCPIFVPK